MTYCNAVQELIVVWDRYEEPTELPACLVQQVRLKYPSVTNKYPSFVGGNAVVPELLNGMLKLQKGEKDGHPKPSSKKEKRKDFKGFLN